ncbi:hypothetical protein FGRMN_6332 [Fusarium graminum]|nr:hypothetical protein FGRMN_6332 [Fusarium graminum]
MSKQNPDENNGLLDSDDELGKPIVEDTAESSKTADWKVSLIGGACACIAVFVVNLVVTIWSTFSLQGIQDGTSTSRRIIYEGSCSKTRELSVAIHLIINAFGSILLAASNYGMQCLSAPTRADVDKAHARQRWVDIGIPSFRNLRKVSGKRVVLWWLLVFSSLPLHLLFNSVVFSSLTTYDYGVFAVDTKLRLLKMTTERLSKSSTSHWRNIDHTIILGVNLIKAAILAFIALRPPKEPLFVLGDAIQSFLKVPDESSRGSCLASAHIVKAGLFTRPCIMNTERRRRGVAVTRLRWVLSLFMYGVAFGTSCGLLIWGISILPGSHGIKSLWDLGFGAATELTMISGLGWEYGQDQSLFWNVLLSNLPQLIFSLLYFQYNGLFTCMAAAREWSEFGRKRSSLRVSSHPRGQQRSRYFLQLPYRFSVPLVLTSILMHWMLSQSIFIVAVEEDDVYGQYDAYWSVLTCGYSPIAMIFVIVTSVFMAAAVIITACRRLPTAMPVAASCSLAIAAACHQPDGIPLPEASLLPLQWGVMWRQREGYDRELTDHCGFSHKSVEQPQDGKLYY